MTPVQALFAILLCRLWPALLVGLTLPGFAPRAEPAQKAVGAAVEVPARNWKGIRLRNLAAGARLELKIASDGEIDMLLLDEAEFRRLPGEATPLVSGRTEDTLALAAEIPATGEWYLVLDNRGGGAPRFVKVDITATAPSAARLSPPAQESRPSVKLSEALELVERALRGTFIVDALLIDTADCGTRNAYAAPGRIVLCNEYLRTLTADLDGDARKISDVLLYVLMHEAAHVLLDAWDLPLRGNEEAADEFAVVLLSMFGQGERVRPTAAYFEALPNDRPAASVAEREIRHPPFAQRSGNLRRWVDDPELARRWQPWLVPHMRTALLEQLDRQPRPWTVEELVKAELEKRR